MAEALDARQQLQRLSATDRAEVLRRLRVRRASGPTAPSTAPEERQLRARPLTSVPQLPHVREQLGSLVPLHSSRSGAAPVFFLHSSGGSALSYLALAQHLDDRPGYGIQAAALAGGPLPVSVSQLARDYAGLIRHVSAAAAPHLVGWSAGGVLALAVAHRLAIEGVEVGVVALLDSSPPPTLDPPPDAADLLARFAVDFALSVGEAPPVLSADELRVLPASDRVAATVDRLDRHGLVRGAREEVTTRARVFVATLSAGATWRPAPYEGPVDLVTAQEGTGSRPSPAEWQHVATGAMRQHAAPGDHYSMLAPSNVPRLGLLLRSLMAGSAPTGPAP